MINQLSAGRGTVSTSCPFATQRRWALSAVLLLLVGTGCARKLDSELIAANIQSELEQTADLAIQGITCPEAIALAPKETFHCTGELTSSNLFVIEVSQTDSPGQVSWTVPSSKGLLNLRDLEQHFQQALAAETMSVPLVNCGGNYRPNQAGDRFECRVINGILNDQTKIEKITVAIDSQQNVSWQQVRQQVRQQLAINQPTTADTSAGATLPKQTSPKPGIDANDQ